jgi:hypothetical protein
MKTFFTLLSILFTHTLFAQDFNFSIADSSQRNLINCRTSTLLPSYGRITSIFKNRLIYGISPILGLNLNSKPSIPHLGMELSVGFILLKKHKFKIIPSIVVTNLRHDYKATSTYDFTMEYKVLCGYFRTHWFVNAYGSFGFPNFQFTHFKPPSGPFVDSWNNSKILIYNCGLSIGYTLKKSLDFVMTYNRFGNIITIQNITYKSTVNGLRCSIIYHF